MKTIKQIAEEIGVSKQAIHKRITREPMCTSLHSYISMVDGIIYIDVDGEKLIKAAYLKNDTDNEPNNKSSTVDSQIHTDTSMYIVLKETIDVLQHQLAVKDDQIYKLAEINRYLSESINTDRHNQLAETLIDGNKLIENNAPKKHNGFFTRLFSK